jgi:carboxyl-terminal processing protease
MRTVHIPCAFALLLVAAGPAASQTADDVVNRAVALVKQRALNAPAVDWPQVESQAAALVVATPGEVGRIAAIQHVLKSLGDGHSFYRPPTPAPANTPLDGNAHAPRPIAEAQAGPAGYGHLTIRGWSGKDLAPPTRQARIALNDALAHDTCGLIVDVSSNGGGNM